MQKYLSDTEKLEYLSFFSEKEGLFQTLVSMGKVVLVDGPHPTAWVTFNKEGEFLNFYFNENFWNTLTFYERCFVIGHECLHVLLYHGARLSEATNKRIANIAADLIVNHLLTSQFGFDENNLSIAQKLCWRTTVFVNSLANVMLPILADSTYEFYYKALVDNSTASSFKLDSIDQHVGGSGDSENNENGDGSEKEVPMDEMTEKQMEDFLNKTFDESNEKEVKDFIKKVEKHTPAENTYGPNPYTTHSTSAKQWRSKANQAWKKIFAKVVKEALQIEEKEYFQWVRKSRRNNLLASGLIVPHGIDVEEMKRDKLFVHLYIDFSGSCRNLQKDFWLAYDSIPKRLFEVELFTYSDVIYSVDKKTREMRGTWGNAPFQIIETNIQNLIKTKKLKKYPHCVVVLTDGHAVTARPENPKNWIWILPRKASTTQTIPKESRVLYLEDINA